MSITPQDPVPDTDPTPLQLSECWDSPDGCCAGAITLRFGVCCPSCGGHGNKVVCTVHEPDWDGETWCEKGCGKLIFSEPVRLVVSS